MTLIAQVEPSFMNNVVYPLLPWLIVFAFVYVMLFVVIGRVIKRQRENTAKIERSLLAVESQLKRIADTLERDPKGG
jgi:flagellar biosynthesis/type III secretory pathway M-ring protein FliF/YscJ